MSTADATILLVDDPSVVPRGYRSVLQKQPGLRVIAQAADGAEAYRLYKSEAPTSSSWYRACPASAASRR